MTVNDYLIGCSLTHFSEPVLSKLDAQVRDMIESVPINFKLRGISRHGVYQHPGIKAGRFGAIKINRFLSPDDAQKTFMHELAHAIERLAYGTHGHGWRWRMIMTAMGQKAERTSRRESLKTYIESKPFHWFYVCKDCGVKVGQYRRLKNPTGRYHAKCRGKFYRGHCVEERAC